MYLFSVFIFGNFISIFLIFLLHKRRSYFLTTLIKIPMSNSVSISHTKKTQFNKFKHNFAVCDNSLHIGDVSLRRPQSIVYESVRKNQETFYCYMHVHWSKECFLANKSANLYVCRIVSDRNWSIFLIIFSANFLSDSE